MKKAVIAVLLMLFLCGCGGEQSEYLVSSMGFDYKNDLYQVYFETVVVNTENKNQILKVLSGRGETIEKATQMIKKQCTRPLLFSHCGVIITNSNMPREKFLEVCDFCYKTEEITLSAYFIKAENPKEIFAIKPISSVSVGYDIMGILKQNKNYKNRFFEIINSNYKTKLPTISKREGGLYFNG